jgi:hypothetical protein
MGTVVFPILGGGGFRTRSVRPGKIIAQRGEVSDRWHSHLLRAR